jgi:hypothetical protein
MLLGLAARCRGADASLQDLKIHYEQGLQRASEAHGKRMEEAESDYLRALDRVRAQLQQEGDLDGILAVDVEKTRLMKERKLPREAGSEHAAIGKLQEDCVQALQRLELERQKDLVALGKKYLQWLDRLMRDLTREGRLEDAIKVRDEKIAFEAGHRAAEAALPASAADGNGDGQPVVTPCKECGGTGYTTGVCPACKGSGTCAGCGGKGSRTSDLTGASVPCLACRGSGRCRRCDGTGRVKTRSRCPACGGRGQTVSVAPPGERDNGRPPSPPPPAPPPPPPTPPLADTTLPDAREPVRPPGGGKTVTGEQVVGQIRDYVDTIAALRAMYERGEVVNVALSTALAERDKYSGLLLRSPVRLVQGFGRNVTVKPLGGGWRLRNKTVDLIPYVLQVGRDAARVHRDVGVDGEVTITYGIVNEQNVTLFDIRAR